MLIVADQDLPQEVADISGLLRHGISLITVPGGLALGEKRNACNVATDCDVICHFDSDDFSSPGRIRDQVERLQSSGKAVTGYRTMNLTDGTSWWNYRGVPDFALGTSLCYRRDWWLGHQFKPQQVQEDLQFVFEAQDCRQIEVSDAGDFMHATIHPGNTSCRMTTDKDGKVIMASNYVPCKAPSYWNAA